MIALQYGGSHRYVWACRKGLQLLGYVTRERADAANQAIQRYGVLPLIRASLAGKDSTVQSAALDLMADLAHHPDPLLAMKKVRVLPHLFRLVSLHYL
jgi:hypothetical protein